MLLLKNKDHHISHVLHHKRQRCFFFFFSSAEIGAQGQVLKGMGKSGALQWTGMCCVCVKAEPDGGRSTFAFGALRNQLCALGPNPRFHLHPAERRCASPMAFHQKWVTAWKRSTLISMGAFFWCSLGAM